ncbi:hypothetical protein KI387_044409, partial [Taxus chinensis]
HRVRISSALITSVIGLKAIGEDIENDLTDKSMILKTRPELGYLKGPHGMDIDKLKNFLVVQVAAHLVTKLKDYEQWSQ